MIAPSPGIWPFGAALWQKGQAIVDVILHIGAHRCATTSFQHYLRRNADALSAVGVGAWGPLRTRSGLLRGIQPGPQITLKRDLTQRAIGRVQLNCLQSQNQGVQTLIVSDENLLGTMRANLRLAELYCGAGERLARYAEAFRGYLSGVVINIRSPEYYWASTLGFAASKGHGVPHANLVARLTAAPRSWRDVITDVACAVPDARVQVAPFERFAGRPEAQLQAITGQPGPMAAARDRHNETPELAALRAAMAPAEGRMPEGEGRWMPFDETQRAILRERYADDLMWLAAGADGLAQLADDPVRDKAGTHLPDHDMTRGRYDERRHIHVARAGRTGAARQAG